MNRYNIGDKVYIKPKKWFNKNCKNGHLSDNSLSFYKYKFEDIFVYTFYEDNFNDCFIILERYIFSDLTIKYSISKKGIYKIPEWALESELERNNRLLKQIVRDL